MSISTNQHKTQNDLLLSTLMRFYENRDHLKKMLSIINGLCIDSANISKNLEHTKGIYFSQRLLLELIRSGACTREEAYSKVQEIAFKVSSDSNSSFENEWF